MKRLLVLIYFLFSRLFTSISPIMDTPYGPVPDADVLAMYQQMRLSPAEIASDFGVSVAVVLRVLGVIIEKGPKDPGSETPGPSL